MRRYKVPRIVFINKLDRMGADPYKVASQVKSKLNLNSAMLQIPIGLESNLSGLIDLVKMEATFFEGPNGEYMRKAEAIPAEFLTNAQKKRQELLERLADGDDYIAECVMEGIDPPVDKLQEVSTCMRT